MELADVVNLSTFAVNTRTRRNIVIGIGALALLAGIEGYNSGISRVLRALRRFELFKFHAFLHTSNHITATMRTSA